jgi:hypothetical protein
MPKPASLFVTACGSSIGHEVAKSLRQAGRRERIVGGEVSDWGTHLGQQYCDEVIRMPRGDEPGFVERFWEVLSDEAVQLAFVNTDAELETLAAAESKSPHFRRPVPLSAPRAEDLRLCIDKGLLHEKLRDESLVAATKIISNPRVDIAAALAAWGEPVWIRCGVGPRGRGSIPVTNTDDGVSWIDYWTRRDGRAAGDLMPGEWLVHEYLPGRNFNWTSIWCEGELVVSAAGERLGYFAAEVAVSGITGNVSHARTVCEPAINETAIRAISTALTKPHGVFSVDLREDRDGNVRVTEFNGRQAFRPLLYTRSGANFSAMLADIMTQDSSAHLSAVGTSAVGTSAVGTSAVALPQIDAAEVGWEIRRGMDHAPLFRKVDARDLEIEVEVEPWSQ